MVTSKQIDLHSQMIDSPDSKEIKIMPNLANKFSADISIPMTDNEEFNQFLMEQAKFNSKSVQQ